MPTPNIDLMYNNKFTQSPVIDEKMRNLQIVGGVASAGATAIHPLLGAAVAGGTQLLAQHMQNKYTRSANEQARAWSLADRAHEELYNSAVMQKLRALEAGLSPADYVSGVATQTNTPTPQAPDMSFLSNAGTSMIEGAMNLQTFNQNQELIASQVKLQEAQAEEAYQRARTAKERYDLELAKSRMETSYLGVQIKQAEKAIEESDLDIQAKSMANAWFEQTRDLNYKMLEGQLEGVKLSNDFKQLEINGKTYEINNILPQEYQSLLKKNELTDKEIERLTYLVGTMLPEYNEAVVLNSLQTDGETAELYWSNFGTQIASELKISNAEAKVAAKFATINAIVDNVPLLKQIFGMLTKVVAK